MTNKTYFNNHSCNVFRIY